MRVVVVSAALVAAVVAFGLSGTVDPKPAAAQVNQQGCEYYGGWWTIYGCFTGHLECITQGGTWSIPGSVNGRCVLPPPTTTAPPTTTTTAPPTTTTTAPPTTTTTVPPPTQGNCPDGYYKITGALPAAWIDLFGGHVSFDGPSGMYHPESVVWEKQARKPRTPDRSCYRARFTVTDSGAVDENALMSAARSVVNSGVYKAVCTSPLKTATTATSFASRADKTRAAQEIVRRIGATGVVALQRVSLVLGIVCLPVTIQTVRDALSWIRSLFPPRPLPAGPPSGLTLTGGNGAIQVSWAAPARDDFKGYRVFWAEYGWRDRPPNKSNHWGWEIVGPDRFFLGPLPGRHVADKTATSHSLTDLTNGAHYGVAVCTAHVYRNQRQFSSSDVLAVDRGDASSSPPTFSESVSQFCVKSVVTPVARPAAPRGLVLIRGAGQIKASWTGATHKRAAPVQGYTISWSDSSGTIKSVQLLPGYTAYTITGLTNGRAYNVSVVAYNASGNSPVIRGTTTPRKPTTTTTTTTTTVTTTTTTTVPPNEPTTPAQCDYWYPSVRFCVWWEGRQLKSKNL